MAGGELSEAGHRVDEGTPESAKYAGLKGPSISRMENGKQAILPRTVRLLCQCYGVGAPEMDMLIRQAEESNDSAWYSMYSDTVPQWELDASWSSATPTRSGQSPAGSA